MKRIIFLLMVIMPALFASVAQPVVEVKTTLGDFKVLLYDDTPLHRDNFLRLVEDGTYDGMLFHRVIKDFMVQTGDPGSKEENPALPLGAGSKGERIPAEIKYPQHYHKYGAVAAARDNNPQKMSSGSQFYIVTGRKFDRSIASKYVTSTLMHARVQEMIDEHKPELEQLSATGGRQALYQKIEEYEKQAQSEMTELPEVILETYETQGGTPHLDGDYTVFGEVIEGMDTVEKIQNVETDASDLPVNEVRVISMKVIKK